ncbi:MAG TPA: ArsR family transcriptional regulator [archaeon]|jgi:ArsR family transcriptional regulator|nr:ArsR family transcriptional regulator [archaeon]
MKSSDMLDILGNANRRTILQLLASRPYFVSELTDRIGLGPKAVLGHLDRLEKSGLIQGKTSKQRRKYYSITENIKLEVIVSPYSYTMETSTVTQHHTTEQGQEQSEIHYNESISIANLKLLNRHLFELESKRRQLSKAQLEIEGEMTDVMARCIEWIYEVAQNDIETGIMLSVLKTPQDRRSLSMDLGLPEYYTEEHIQSLLDRNVMSEKKQGNKQLLSLI